MTPSSTESRPRPDAGRMAALVATACVMQVAESMIPHPVPGIRLGLANMVTLVAMAQYGFAAAMEVALLRAVLGSLVLGTFLSPGFLLSFVSAGFSTLVMWAAWTVSVRFPGKLLSIVGVSVAGAAAHNASQLVLAYLFLVRHESIFYFVPWMAAGAAGTGWLTGLVAAEVVSSGGVLSAPLKSGAAPAATPARVPAGSLFRRLSPEAKISFTALLLAGSALAGSLDELLIPGAVAAVLTLASRPDRARLRWLGGRATGLAWLAAASFIFPVLFTRGGGDILLSAGPFSLTEQGLMSGSVFAARIMIMGWFAFLLNMNSTPAEISAGIARLGGPLRRLGFPADRAAAVIGLAWEELPSFTERAKISARTALAGRARGGFRKAPLRWIVGTAAAIVAGMCRLPEGGTVSA